MNLCEAGDHIVSAGTLYGGTSNLLAHSFKKFGVETTFVDQNAPEDEIFAAVRPNTKLIFGESLSNPSVKVLDFEKFARVARRAGIPFAVDNTFPTPCLCRPFDYGANIVTHSLSKYADGHACSLGGIVVDKATSTTKPPANSRGSRPPTRATTGSSIQRRSGISPSPQRRARTSCETSE